MLDLPMVKHRNVESIIVLEGVSDNAVRHYLILDDGQKPILTVELIVVWTLPPCLSSPNRQSFHSHLSLFVYLFVFRKITLIGL